MCRWKAHLILSEVEGSGPNLSCGSILPHALGMEEQLLSSRPDPPYCTTFQLPSGCSHLVPTPSGLRPPPPVAGRNPGSGAGGVGGPATARWSRFQLKKRE